MALSANTEFWVERLRAEAAAIPDPTDALVASMMMAEVELAHGFEVAARATLIHCLQRFDILHHGHWSPLVTRAAQLCGRLSLSQLLEPDVRRGLAWLADPEIVKYHGGLREEVHDLAIQVGWADVVANLTPDQWPGTAANKQVDACRLAGWAEDAAELRCLLPRAREAISTAGTGPDHVRESIGYHLVRACVRAGLLTEASALGESFGFPLEATDELVIALQAAPDPAAYARFREGWLAHRIDRFRAETLNHHWSSSAVRHCAETIRRLGDAEGYRNAVRRFKEAVAAWTPNDDWIACSVNCDLAVMCAKVGDGRDSADCLSAAKCLFEGKQTGVSSHRGSRSLMASIVSAVHRDVGDIDLAVRFARRISGARERRMHLVSALIVGGRVPAAETELGKLKTNKERAYLIGFSLMTEFRVGTSSETIILPIP